MTQTRLGSLLEAGVNILIGYTINTAANYIILPYFVEGVTVAVSMEIGLWFTLISLVRSYAVRRWFNARIHRALSR